MVSAARRAVGYIGLLSALAVGVYLHVEREKLPTEVPMSQRDSDTVPINCVFREDAAHFLRECANHGKFDI